MSKERLNKEELELLGTESGAYAVVLGYLKSVDNKITPSKFNKLIKELGYERVRPADLANFAHSMQEANGVLYSLYTKSFRREIKLDDLPDAIGEDKGLEEKNVFDLLSPQVLMKEKHSMDMKEFRKLQKDGTLMKLMLDDLKKDLAEELKGLPRAKYLKTVVPQPKRGDRSLVLTISDLHIGASILESEEGGGYNFNILTQSMQDIVDETLKLVEEMEIKHLYFLNLGDITEGFMMRPGQPWEVEMTNSQQIGKAVRLTTEILMQLSKGIHVTYGMVAGNHCQFRAGGSKESNVTGDTTTYAVLDILIDTVQGTLGQLPNVTILDNREYILALELEIAGKRIKAVHGDKEGKKGAPRIVKHIKEKPIDILYAGHLHSTSIQAEDYARFSIIVGSPMHYNDYSKGLNLPLTYGAQMITILEEGLASPMFFPLVLKKGRLR